MVNCVFKLLICKVKKCNVRDILEREFKVVDVVNGKEFVMITLKILDAPPIFTKVFGMSKH